MAPDMEPIMTMEPLTLRSMRCLATSQAKK